MNRRTFLSSCGVTATIGLAGCGGTARNEAGEPRETTTTEPVAAAETTVPAPSIAGRSISTTKASCGSTDGKAAVGFDSDRSAVTVDGVISASNPCHKATIESVSYDPEPNTVTVTIGTKSTGKDMCTQCLARVDYAAKVNFDDGLPGQVVVKHGKTDPITVADVNRS